MSSEASSGPTSDLTITEHELEECKRANATGKTSGRVCSWPMAAPKQLGQVGSVVRGERLRSVNAGLAR
jgi:hypothetical protein